MSKLVLGALGLLLAAMVAAYIGLLQLGALPRLGFAPGWSLIDHEGRRITSEEFRGSIVLYTFTYTHNRDPRRDVFPVLRRVEDQIKEAGAEEVPVVLMTIYFDAKTAPDDAAPSGHWRVATGTAETLYQVVNRGFGVYYQPLPNGTFAFDPVFVLVDGWGIERARYAVGLPDPAQIVADLRSVTREAAAADGPARLAYEAAHFFSCYSRKLK